MTWENLKDQSWLADQRARDERWRREKTNAAYHESGHVFWVWLTGGRVVSVNATATGEAGGETAFRHPGNHPLLAWDAPEVLDYVRMCLAGVCSQFKGCGFTELWDIDEGGRQDIIKAMAFLVQRGWEGSEGKPWVKYDMLDFFVEFSGGDGGPRRVIHEHQAWKCIQALAERLLAETCLSGQEAVQVILDAWGDDRPLPPKALPLEAHGTKSNAKGGLEK
jgi:hypothetical protein